MRCDEALERMLEAGPAELRGEADTGLAAHIAACDRCAAVAAAMLEEADAVDAALDEYAVGRPMGEAAGADAPTGHHTAADAAADAALAAVREEAAGAIPLAQPTAPWIRRAWVPLAAAAALAAVLVLRQAPAPLPMGAPPSDEPTVQPRVSVTPPADKGAAIMATENPNITIVWLYEREES